jgi:cyclase
VVINTEVHPDHTTGNFVFSPRLCHQSRGRIRSDAKGLRPGSGPTRWRRKSAEMRDAVQGYRLVTPHIEYHDKSDLAGGERTFELLHFKNVHSEADTAVWLPKERVLFAASVAIPNSINNIRRSSPFPTCWRRSGR